MEYYQRFPINSTGRDFIVGDIHGMYNHLQRLIDSVTFDPTVDRLFSVGDLVDRGECSEKAIDWLEHPWFHACRGNHDQMVIDASNPLELHHWITENGGEWWLSISNHLKRKFKTAFSNLPFALEIDTNSGKVGIVHADIPLEFTWEQFLDALNFENEELRTYAVWSRNRIMQGKSKPVKGNITRIYCGHTPVYEPVQIDNFYFIDTGAAYAKSGFDDAKLTMVQIQPEAHKIFALSTIK